MMMREEAIKLLKQYQGYDPMFPDGETLKHAFDLTDETVDTLLSALRPVSREHAEKVWRGEWIDAYPGTSSCKCTKCGAVQEYESTFCCHCGAPMTDKAVEMVMERLEAIE